MGGGCALSREMAFPSCKLSDLRRTSISRDARMKFWSRYAPKVCMGQPGHFRPRPAKTFQKVFAAISDFLRNFSMCHDGKDGGALGQWFRSRSISACKSAWSDSRVSGSSASVKTFIPRQESVGNLPVRAWITRHTAVSATKAISWQICCSSSNSCCFVFGVFILWIPFPFLFSAVEVAGDGKENVFRQHSSEALTKPEGNDCRKTQKRHPKWMDGFALSLAMPFPSLNLSDFRRTSSHATRG